MGTYQDPERGECLPCNQHCDRGVGCAGPLPILDQQNGCLDCDLVQLTVSGFQVCYKEGEHFYSDKGLNKAKQTKFTVYRCTVGVPALKLG